MTAPALTRRSFTAGAAALGTVAALGPPLFARGSAAPRRRTLLDADGHLLRGTKLVVGKQLPDETAWSLREASWRAVRALGLNTLRLGWVDPWYRHRGYPHGDLAYALPKLDRAVELARTTGTNLILNYQDVGGYENGRRDFQPLRAFWGAVAPRYAGEPRVFYELENEPCFDQAVYFDPAFREPYLEVYRQVRRDAPDRPVLALSFNSIDHDLLRIVDAYAGAFDWDKTTVAFHLYGGGGTTAKVRALVDKYPAMCTEWDYPGTHPYVHRLDGRLLSGRNLEDLGLSWVDWSGWDDTSLSKVREVLLPDAEAKGYAWGAGGPLGPLDPPPVLDVAGTWRLDAGGGALAADGTVGDAAAAWRFARLPDGRYRVEAADPSGAGGGCLTGGEDPGDAAAAVGWDGGWLSQRWRAEPVRFPGAGGPARVRLRCEWTDLPLAAPADPPGPAVMAAGDDDGPATVWTLTPAA